MSTIPGAVPAAALEAALRFINRNKPATVTESVAKETFAEVLKSAARKPVTVTRNGKPAAVLLSARRYGELEKLLQELAPPAPPEQKERGASAQSEKHDLADVYEDAKEHGYPAPSQISVDLAKKILDAIGGRFDFFVDVSTTRDRDVVLHAQERHGYGVFVFCHENGKASCYAGNDRVHYGKASAAQLPDNFIWDALNRV